MYVAAPVYNNSNHEIGAISVSGPAHRTREKNFGSLISQAMNAARRISMQLVFRGREEERRIA
jgi:DNA-binding IclR family transcriptional regulator